MLYKLENSSQIIIITNFYYYISGSWVALTSLFPKANLLFRKFSEIRTDPWPCWSSQNPEIWSYEPW